jgi:pyruvate dehydrogenase E2 component (dihydrolipoamide acetyltransferase)|tara:strand:+ start:164 stop:424 length:261 start_codon:yes stop_codon:yes gene_type:complete
MSDFSTEGLKEIIIPKLYEDMDKAILIEWYGAEGDEVESGQDLFSIETEKSVFDIEAEDDGVLRRILVEGRSNVYAQQVVGYLEPD